MEFEELLRELYPIDFNCGNIGIVKGVITKWTLSDAPQPSLEDARKMKNNKDIKAQLEELDLKSIRALRADDTAMISDLESQAILLRAELQ